MTLQQLKAEKQQDMIQEAKQEASYEKMMYSDIDYFIDHTISESCKAELHNIQKACLRYGYDFKDLIQDI